jgi:hypothetical protein
MSILLYAYARPRSLIYPIVTVELRRRRYGEDHLPARRSAMHVASISNLEILLGPPTSRGQARWQRPRHPIENEATRLLQQ